MTLKCAVLSHSTMPQMSQILREHAIGMLTAAMSTRAVALPVRGMDYLGKGEVLTNTDLDRFVNNI